MAGADASSAAPTAPADWWRRLGLAGPVVQAPMAGVQDHRLAAAVCQAGALGSLPAAMLAPAALAAELQALRAATTGPFNVNFFCHTPPVPDAAREQRWRAWLARYYAEAGLDPQAVPAGAGRAPFSDALADVLEPLRPAVVSFHFGLPAAALIDRVKRWGSLIVSSATTVDEGLWLQDLGADLVIAQGLEAGGHRGHFLDDDLSRQMGLLALLPRLARALGVPVLAAGGVADAAAVRAARQLGAAGVQVGTAYLCTPEATTSALHRAQLAGDAARHTALTNLFTGRPARGIVNRLMRDGGLLSPEAPAFPLATAALAPLRAAAEARGSTDFTPLWAGQRADACRTVPAAELTRELLAAWSA